MANLFHDPQKLQTSVEQIQSLFNQKTELGLIKGATWPIVIEPSAKPEIILVLANHKPASTVLERELGVILALQEYKELKQVCDVQ